MLLQFLTIDQIATLTPDQIGTLTLSLDCNNYGDFSYVISRLLAPITNPTGIWADFNPINRYYQKLINTPGLIPIECLPQPPNPADYGNLTLPRSTIWVNWGPLSNQIE